MTRRRFAQQEALTREQFEMMLRRAGLLLPRAEYDNLYEGAAYIERLIGRLSVQTEDRGGSGPKAAGSDPQWGRS